MDPRFPNNNDAEDQAHPPVPLDDQARSPGSEDEELFERVRSSNPRGSAEAVKAPDQLLSGLSLGSQTGEAEFTFSGKRDPYEDHIGQSDQSDNATRATANFFTRPKEPVFRGFSAGPTAVAPQLPGVDGNSAAFDGTSGLGLPPSLRPPEAQSASASQFKGVPANTEGLNVPDLVTYYRLETHTSSTVTLGGSDTEVDVVNAINMSLGAQNIDFEFKPHKAKWKCCHAQQGVCVFFAARLWKKEAAKEYVVEFQRRHGDAASFMGFYRATVQALHASGMGPECRARKAPAAFGPASSQSLMGLQVPSMSPIGLPSQDEIENYVVPLKEMVESRTLDSVLEATRALAQLSSQPEHRMAMHSCGIVQVLVDFLSDATIGLLETAAQIFAIACLANLSEEPMLQSSLYGASPMLLGHVSNGEYSDRAMRREAARTLRNLAQDDEGADAMIKWCGKDTLESWCAKTLPGIEDASMLQDATLVQEKIMARWQLA
mmetsp:Transcript_68564/g.190825  ORF Transcript_68564/g.190825 Transcript_68564/m.190825 type:complete len:490 (-) Transcript_68564:2065-3534(-)